jgi:uncharacterized protein (UPF0276 family)
MKTRRWTGPIPACAGIGLRAPHVPALLAERPRIGWLEIHSENYFSAGGPHLAALEDLRHDYPLSLHGVGLSLGSCDELDQRHLRALRTLVERFEPYLVSEHLSWGAVGNRHLNDLLPLPYTEEALGIVVRAIDHVQELLGRRILIENVSSYLEFNCSSMREWDFINEVVARSGCGILLDVNNVYVSARNHGFDAHDYLAGLAANRVEEIHLAGHSIQRFDGHDILVDTHDHRVCEAVWSLLAIALERTGAVPALIEWDSELPDLATLLDEAARADQYLRHRNAIAA